MWAEEREVATFLQENFLKLPKRSGNGRICLCNMLLLRALSMQFLPALEIKVYITMATMQTSYFFVVLTK